MFTFSQVVGVVAFLLFIYSVQRREKSEVLFVQIFAFTLYTNQYISVNEIVGTIIYFLNTLRCLLFYFLEKRKRDTKLYFVACIFYKKRIDITNKCLYNNFRFIGQ